MRVPLAKACCKEVISLIKGHRWVKAIVLFQNAWHRCTGRAVTVAETRGKSPFQPPVKGSNVASDVKHLNLGCERASFGQWSSSVYASFVCS